MKYVTTAMSTTNNFDQRDLKYTRLAFWRVISHRTTVDWDFEKKKNPSYFCLKEIQFYCTWQASIYLYISESEDGLSSEGGL